MFGRISLLGGGGGGEGGERSNEITGSLSVDTCFGDLSICTVFFAPKQTDRRFSERFFFKVGHMFTPIVDVLYVIVLFLFFFGGTWQWIQDAESPFDRYDDRRCGLQGRCCTWG